MTKRAIESLYCSLTLQHPSDAVPVRQRPVEAKRHLNQRVEKAGSAPSVSRAKYSFSSTDVASPIYRQTVLPGFGVRGPSSWASTAGASWCGVRRSVAVWQHTALPVDVQVW